MGGGLESRCVGRMCGADVAVQLVVTSWGVVRVNGILHIRHHIRGISTISRGRTHKTPAQHKQHNLLHQICRWYPDNLWLHTHYLWIHTTIHKWNPHYTRLEPTTETDSRINYLELLITRNPTKLVISIFRKPTSTDTATNFYSNHSLEHKVAAYRFHIERIFTLPLAEEQQQEEWESIKQRARNNNYPINLFQKLKQRIQRELSHPTLPSKSSDTKWATFTYTTPQIRKVTNIFKQTNVKIAYKTNNTILQLTRPTTCQQRGLRRNMHYMQSGVCRSN